MARPIAPPPSKPPRQRNRPPSGTGIELVWPGKAQLLAQLAEPAAAPPRLQRRERVERGAPDDAGWCNRLILGDNLAVAQALLPELAGQADLIYLDPPFGTGQEFTATTPVGPVAAGRPARSRTRVVQAAFGDRWNGEGADFLSMLYPRLRVARELLAERGTLVLHLDARMASAARLILDELFGAASFLNEVIWHYRRWPTPARAYQPMHDNLLFYVKCPGRHLFQVQYGPRSDQTRRRWQDRRIVAAHDAHGRIPSAHGEQPSPGAPLDDVWDLPIIAPVAHERTGYPTQKPEALLARIIRGATEPDSLVLDLCCGSGTTLAVAERLGRRWIGCDLGWLARDVTRKRLIDLAHRSAPPGPERARSWEIWTTAPLAAAEEAGPWPEVELRPEGPGRDGRQPVRVWLTEARGPEHQGVPDRSGDAGIEALDSWAVDWDHRTGLFRNHWESHRTRRQPTLDLATPVHELGPGPTRICVRVIDLQGREGRREVVWPG